MEVKAAFDYFKLLEDQFWRNKSKEAINYLTFNGELKVEDMLLYGEFGFALLELKPNVLIDFRDIDENKNYFLCVIYPVLQALKENPFHYHTIVNAKSIEADLKGCIILYTISKPIKEIDLLLNDKKHENIPENTLAKILSYPGNLPKTENEIQTMKSAIYFHDCPKGLIALTTFAIQDFQKEATIEHFKLYSTTCKDKLGINLKLMIE